MIWVCRAGQKSIFYDYYINNSRIYLPWDGFNINLDSFRELAEFRDIVSKEKDTDNRTTISNLAVQLKAFSVDMNIGDYVLIPSQGSRKYTFAEICGEYEYDALNEKELWHSRRIHIIKADIPRDVFEKSMQYSLGAFRTIFKVHRTEEYLQIIDKMI